MIKCWECGREFEDHVIQLSHDIPKYLGGNDSDGRHYLCPNHHHDYEMSILIKCLEFLGEDFIEQEAKMWMAELKRQPEELKKKLRDIANKIKRSYFEDDTKKYS